jgi:hypothetical protein
VRQEARHAALPVWRRGHSRGSGRAFLLSAERSAKRCVRSACAPRRARACACAVPGAPRRSSSSASGGAARPRPPSCEAVHGRSAAFGHAHMRRGTAHSVRGVFTRMQQPRELTRDTSRATRSSRACGLSSRHAGGIGGVRSLEKGSRSRAQ